MKPVFSLGVMTGTSCDGADLALLKIVDGTERLEATASKAFPAPLRARLRAAQRGTLDIASTAALTRDYSAWIGLLCRQALVRWRRPAARTLIAVHGQTVWHAPDRGITVQLLDASLVAAITECTVTAAFRQPDVARGGEGAPLVPFYHWIRSVTGPFADKLPFAIHNVGGIANLTYVSRDRDKVLAFDTGPGNCLIDLATEKTTRGRSKIDRGGRIAASALQAIDWDGVRRLARGAYFARKPPKSTGRELFNEAYLRKLPGRGPALVANATALTAHTMARAYVDFVLPVRPKLNAVFIAGGGARNPTLLRLFHSEYARLTGTATPVAALSDAFAPAQSLEAMAFARLGYEALHGRPVSLAVVTGARDDAIGAGIFPGLNFRALLKSLDMS